MAASPPDRIAQFDGLRAFAFLAVFLHHALAVPLLWMGVDLFFVLSGFLITRNLIGLRTTATTSSALATFFYRRVLRIIPPYFAALTLVLIVRPVGAAHIPWFYAFASNIHDVIYGPIPGALNTFWSIAVEEQFYLVWPALVLFLSRRVLPAVFVACVVAAAVARFAVADWGFNAVYRLTFCRMDLLAAGALLALLDRRDPAWFARARVPLATLALGALAGFGLLTVAVPTFRTNLNLPLFNVVGFGLSTVFFTSILAYARGAGPIVVRVLTLPPLAFVGKVSYMAYLVHEFALGIVGERGWGRAPTAVIALGMTLAIAAVSWYGLEQPLTRLRGWVAIKPRA